MQLKGEVIAVVRVSGAIRLTVETYEDVWGTRIKHEAVVEIPAHLAPTYPVGRRVHITIKPLSP